jgi:hypothetical protein
MPSEVLHFKAEIAGSALQFGFPIVRESGSARVTKEVEITFLSGRPKVGQDCKKRNTLVRRRLIWRPFSPTVLT